MLDERAADAFAVPVGIDEQRLHMRAVDQHEADGAIVGVGCQPCGSLGQEGGHFLIDRVTIGGLEEVMGRIDGAAPDVDEAGAIGGAGGSDRYHGHAYNDEAPQTKGRATEQRLSAARGARPDGRNFGF